MKEHGKVIMMGYPRCGSNKIVLYEPSLASAPIYPFYDIMARCEECGHRWKFYDVQDTFRVAMRQLGR